MRDIHNVNYWEKEKNTINKVYILTLIRCHLKQLKEERETDILLPNIFWNCSKMPQLNLSVSLSTGPIHPFVRHSLIDAIWTIAFWRRRRRQHDSDQRPLKNAKNVWIAFKKSNKYYTMWGGGRMGILVGHRMFSAVGQVGFSSQSLISPITAMDADKPDLIWNYGEFL